MFCLLAKQAPPLSRVAWKAIKTVDYRRERFRVTGTQTECTSWSYVSREPNTYIWKDTLAGVEGVVFSLRGHWRSVMDCPGRSEACVNSATLISVVRSLLWCLNTRTSISLSPVRLHLASPSCYARRNLGWFAEKICPKWLVLILYFIVTLKLNFICMSRNLFRVKKSSDFQNIKRCVISVKNTKIFFDSNEWWWI